MTPGASRLRHLVASGLVLAAVGLLGPVAAGADSTVPTLSPPTAVADHTTVRVGDYVKVQGTGWGIPGPLVSVQVCGNAGISESSDCDLGTTAEAAVRDGGIFYTGLTVHVPPKPCPCVLRAFSPAQPSAIFVPIIIEGVPVAPLQGQQGVLRSVVISDVSIQGSGPWTSWFGFAPERDLVFSLTNTGDTVLHHPSVTLAWGKGSSPDGFIPPPDLGDVAPHQTTVTRVPVPLHALSFGTYRVTINARPVGGESAVGFAETTMVPWGLVVLALILLQGLLVMIRNRFRRRLVPPTDGEPGGEGDSSSPAGTAVPVAPGPDESLHPSEASSRSGPDLVVRRRRWLALGVGPMLLLGVAAGCGSSSHRTTAPTVPADPACPLTQSTAEDLLGVPVGAVELAPVGTALIAPAQRCEYQGGSSSVQLSVFPGTATADSLKQILGKAEPAPDITVGAYCEAHQGQTNATSSCVFVTGGDTYVLVVNVANADLNDQIKAKTHTLASVLANKV